MPTIRNSGIILDLIIRRPGCKRITISDQMPGHLYRIVGNSVISFLRRLGALFEVFGTRRAFGARLAHPFVRSFLDPLRFAAMLAYNPGFFIFIPSGENGAAITPPHSIRSG
jgi:hypothetical protein